MLLFFSADVLSMFLLEMDSLLASLDGMSSTSSTLDSIAEENFRYEAYFSLFLWSEGSGIVLRVISISFASLLCVFLLLVKSEKIDDRGEIVLAHSSREYSIGVWSELKVSNLVSFEVEFLITSDA